MSAARPPLPDDPTELASLIQVQPGAVVSRTLHKGVGGTLTLFAFDVGEGLSEHQTPLAAFVVAVQGSCEITVGEERYMVAAGQILPLPADVPHALRAATPFIMLLVMIRQEERKG